MGAPDDDVIGREHRGGNATGETRPVNAFVEWRGQEL